MNVPSVPEGPGEIFLNVYAVLKADTRWAEKGFAVANEQFAVRSQEPQQIAATDKKVDLKEMPTAMEIRAGSVVVLIEKSSGALSSWKVNGKELLNGVLEPYFWKPANENQYRNGYEKRLGPWKEAAAHRTVKKVDATQQDGLVKVRCTMELSDIGAAYTLDYTINGIGRIQVTTDYQPQKDSIPLMPKFGMRMRLKDGYDQVAWYGRGPFENYPDRKTGSLIGQYGSVLDDFITDYVVPQDNANRCDVRWFSLSGSNLPSVRVTGLQPLCFRVWPYGEEDLEHKRHPYEVRHRDFINVNIDLNIHGVGGNDSWGAKNPESIHHRWK